MVLTKQISKCQFVLRLEGFIFILFILPFIFTFLIRKASYVNCNIKQRTENPLEEQKFCFLLSLCLRQRTCRKQRGGGAAVLN